MLDVVMVARTLVVLTLLCAPTAARAFAGALRLDGPARA
jgi:hypothetical protein